MKKNKVGRPRKKEKVELMAAYLLPKEKKRINKEFGNLTTMTRRLFLDVEIIKNNF